MSKRLDISIKQVLLCSVLLLSIVFLPVLSRAQGATNDAEQVVDHSINGQFETLSRKSTSYKEKGKSYKVIEQAMLDNYHSNVMDSLEVYYEQIQKHNDIVAGVNKQLEEQTAQMEQLQADLDEAQRTIDSIKVFGQYMTKTAYNSMMWGIIIVLLVLLVVLFGMYKKGYSTVKSTKNKLKEVEADLEEHRKNSLVREQKLARELMNEKIKNKKG